MRFTFILYYLTTSALNRLHSLGIRMLLRWVSLHLFPVSLAHNSARLRIPARELPEKLSAAGGALGHLCGSADGWTATQPRSEEPKEGKGIDGQLWGSRLKLQLFFVFFRKGGTTCSGVWSDLLTLFTADVLQGRKQSAVWSWSPEVTAHTVGLPSPLGKTRFCTWSLVPVRVCVCTSAQQRSPSKRCCWCRSEERILLLFLPHRFN